MGHQTASEHNSHNWQRISSPHVGYPRTGMKKMHQRPRMQLVARLWPEQTRDDHVESSDCFLFTPPPFPFPQQQPVATAAASSPPLL